MVTIRSNSSSTILAQANEILNRPVVKKTAVALTGLALAGAVAALAYNKFFQNVQIDPCQPMSSNSFPYPTYPQPMSSNSFPYPTYPQPMSSNSFPYPTYPQPIALQATNQTAENRTLAATPSVAENNTELKVQPVQSQNVTNKETLSGYRIVFKEDFKSKEKFSLFDKIIYGAIDFGSAAVDTTSNIVQKATSGSSYVLSSLESLGSWAQKEASLTIAGWKKSAMNAAREFRIFKKTAKQAFDIAKDFGSSGADKASGAISNTAKKVSAVLTEARNFGHESIFPRF